MSFILVAAAGPLTKIRPFLINQLLMSRHLRVPTVISGGAGFERGQFHRFTGPMGTIVTGLKWDQRLKCQARSSALMVNQTDA
ncbi:MAG TPA: hypothetical protein VIG33_13785, partial [Pseudobdellovibrionaceae bacterium]